MKEEFSEIERRIRRKDKRRNEKELKEEFRGNRKRIEEKRGEGEEKKRPTEGEEYQKE